MSHRSASSQQVDESGTSARLPLILVHPKRFFLSHTSDDHYDPVRVVRFHRRELILLNPLYPAGIDAKGMLFADSVDADGSIYRMDESGVFLRH